MPQNLDLFAEDAPDDAAESPPRPLGVPQQLATDIELIDLGKQQRNLVLMRPLFQFELNKHSIGTNEDEEPIFKGVDTHYLVLSALDFMMESTTTHSGCTYAELIDRLSAVAGCMKPQLTAKQRRRMADAVVETLVNGANKHQEFEFEVFDSNSKANRTVRFRLVEFGPGFDGDANGEDQDTYRYRPTAEGYLVYLGMLDLAPDDAQELMEKMLAVLMERGRFADAVDIARRAYTHSLEFGQAIKTQIDQAKRAPDSVKWTAQLRLKLEDANKHVAARQREDNQMTESVHRHLETADEPQTRSSLKRLSDILKKANVARATLVSRITRAPDEFRGAQERLFRARKRSGLPDLEKNILPELLKLEPAALTRHADTAICAIYAAKFPKVYGLNRLFTTLLETRKEAPAPEEDEEVVELYVPPLPPFSQEALDAARAWLSAKLTAGKAKVGELLAEAEADGLDRDLQTLIVFYLFQSFSDIETLFPAMHATALDDDFKCAVAQGTDLIFNLRTKEPT